MKPSWCLAGDKTRYRYSLTLFRASTITSVCFLVNTTRGKELLILSQSTILLSLNTTYTWIPFLRWCSQSYSLKSIDKWLLPIWTSPGFQNGVPELPTWSFREHQISKNLVWLRDLGIPKCSQSETNVKLNKPKSRNLTRSNMEPTWHQTLIH